MKDFRRVLEFVYAPAYFLGFVGVAVVCVARGMVFALVPLLIAAVALQFVAEQAAPFSLAWNSARGDRGRDLVHALVNEGSMALTVLSLPMLASVLPDAGLWPHGWPLAVQLLVAIATADIGITFAHRLSHEVPLLWRFHAVHHSVERMYGFNGLMKHPLHQAFETLCGTAPLVLLGMPFEVAALLGFAVAIQLLLQHANVDLRVGPLTGIWAISGGHRHHHLADEVLGNVNYGLFTLLWDHLMGTAVLDRPAPKDGELGLAGRSDYPRAYLPQFVEPFRRIG